MNTTNTMTAAEFVEHVKEFRQFGYDPYNSADDACVWFRVSESMRVDRQLPA